MTRPSVVTGHRTSPLRAGVFALISAAAWLGVVATAIVFYEPLSYQGGYYRAGELIGFATAFAVSGSLAAIAATVMYGAWRRAVVTAVLIVILSPLPALEVRRVLSPNIESGSLGWSDAVDTFRAGVILAAPVGLAAAAFVTALAWATRRRLSWRIGLLAAVAICAAMVWIIPPTVGFFWRLATRYREELDLGRGPIQGGVIGAVIGSICGSVVGAMMARWPGDAQRDPSAIGEGTPR